MDDYSSLGDGELLMRLRSEYLQALQLNDFVHISGIIEPRFRERFGKYYEQYTRSWRGITSGEARVQVVMDPGQWKRMERDWMDRVLRGEIELGI
jgi:hypothetical protein